MHAPSGLFVSAYYGKTQVDGFVDLRTWQVQGGIEQKFFSAGDTTIYAEYADMNLSNGIDASPKIWGFGIVQQIDAAAMDIYAGYRNYKLDFAGDDTADVFQVGARIKF